jgi:hypothetical protein
LSEIKDDDEEVEDIIDYIERTIWEQQAGRVYGLSEFSPEEWQLLVLWRGLEKEFERLNQMKIAAILEAAFLKK